MKRKKSIRFEFSIKKLTRKINKILLLTDGIYPFVMGGMQKHSYFLAKYITLNNIEVTVAHCTSNIGMKNELKEKEFNGFKKNLITLNYFTFPKTDSFPGHYLRESKQYSENLYRFYKDKLVDYDLIYSQGFTAWKFIDKSNVPPIFVNFHGYEMFQVSPSLRVKLEHLMLRKSVIYISKNASYVFSFGGVISKILSKLNVSSENIIECPIGIEEDWLNNQALTVNKIRKFVFVGRYERRKGIEEFTQTINDLSENIDARFHFIGPISENHQIKDSRVTYHGSISNPEEIKKILMASDVLVCPSFSEGMPTVIMEAMACGLAILSTDVGAISNQVDNNNGVLIPFPIVNDLSKAISTFVNMDDNKLLEMKKVSLLRVKEKFLWSKVIKFKLNEIHKKIN